MKQTQTKLEVATARARAEAFRDAATLLDTRHVDVDGVRLLKR